MENEEAALAASALLRAQQDPEAGGELDEAGTPVDLVEIEHDGQSYKIPSALKGAFLMNADYTRKTQELAEQRRALEEGRATLAQRAEVIQGSIQDRARLMTLDQQLTDFENVDWQAYAAQDPENAQALWSTYQSIAQAREQYVYALQHQEQQTQLAAQREMAEQMARAGQVLSREIDGWSPEVAQKLVDYAGAFGVTLDELRETADPRLWKILHRAYAADEAEKQQQAAKKAVQAQAVRPAVQIAGGAASPGAVRDELATNEWMRRRNEQARMPR